MDINVYFPFYELRDRSKFIGKRGVGRVGFSPTQKKSWPRCFNTLKKSWPRCFIKQKSPDPVLLSEKTPDPVDLLSRWKKSWPCCFGVEKSHDPVGLVWKKSGPHCWKSSLLVYLLYFVFLYGYFFSRILIVLFWSFYTKKNHFRWRKSSVLVYLLYFVFLCGYYFF